MIRFNSRSIAYFKDDDLIIEDVYDGEKKGITIKEAVYEIKNIGESKIGFVYEIGDSYRWKCYDGHTIADYQPEFPPHKNYSLRRGNDVLRYEGRSISFTPLSITYVFNVSYGFLVKCSNNIILYDKFLIEIDRFEIGQPKQIVPLDDYTLVIRSGDDYRLMKIKLKENLAYKEADCSFHFL
jgi:hypothetical protein